MGQRKPTKPKAPAVKYKCLSCGVKYISRVANFMITNSPLFANNEGFLPVCRNCVENRFKVALGHFGGNVGPAIEHCCQMLDWYYDDVIVAATNGEGATSRILLYPSKLNMRQFKAKGKTYLDTIIERKSKPTLEIIETDDPFAPSRETIRFFGNGFTNEDYAFLQEQYDDWTTRYECSTKAQEELFKAICVAQLTIQETQRGVRDVKEIEKAMKTFQDLLKTADLKPNRSTSEAAGQETFGQWIKKIENERPIGKPDPEWEDVDGIQKYIETWFLGHLCNLAKIKNPNEAEYQEELAKYTVKPPEPEERL